MTPIPIEVAPSSGRPERVRVRGRWHRVRRVVDGWVVRSRWWGEEETRLYVRLETTGAVIEVYRVGGAWRLARILD